MTEFAIIIVITVVTLSLGDLVHWIQHRWEYHRWRKTHQSYTLRPLDVVMLKEFTEERD